MPTKKHKPLWSEEERRNSGLYSSRTTKALREIAEANATSAFDQHGPCPDGYESGRGNAIDTAWEQGYRHPSAKDQVSGLFDEKWDTLTKAHKQKPMTGNPR